MHVPYKYATDAKANRRFPRTDFALGLGISSVHQWWLCEWLCPKEADASEPGVKNENRSSTEKHEDGMEDMYAIGLQEVVDLNAVNVAIDHKSQARHNKRRTTIVLEFYSVSPAYEAGVGPSIHLECNLI